MELATAHGTEYAAFGIAQPYWEWSKDPEIWPQQFKQALAARGFRQDSKAKKPAAPQKRNRTAKPPITFSELGSFPADAGELLPLKERFHASLPKFPLCSDDLERHGSWRERKNKAITMPFIGPNTRGLVSTMNFDLDFEDAAFAWEEANVLPPNTITQNRDNGKCHYGYFLVKPVSRSANSRPRPVSLLDAIKRGMTARLHGDRGYAHVLTKTPDHPNYRTTWLSNRPYDLHDFLVFLEPQDMEHWHRPKQDESEFAERGRNCSLTSDLAKYGLRQALKCQDASQNRDFGQLMRVYAFDLNSNFEVPLGVRELTSVIKSVTAWAWMSASHGVFSEIQRARARMRWKGHVSAELTKPWEALGIGRRTWYDRKGSGLLAPQEGRISDMALCNGLVPGGQFYSGVHTRYGIEQPAVPALEAGEHLPPHMASAQGQRLADARRHSERSSRKGRGMTGTACNKAPAAPGYEQCRLPHSIVDDTQLDLAALFLLSYRVRQSPGWGTKRHDLARDFGFGRENFYSAVEKLADAGYMERTTTKRRNLAWFAREKLDFSEAPKGRKGYQHLPRAMPGIKRQPGSKSVWKQHALLLYLNSQALGFALVPERIGHRFNIHVKTVRRLMAPLVQCGLATEGTISGVYGYIRCRKRGQKQHVETGQSPHTETGQKQHIPYREEQSLGRSCASTMKRLLATPPGGATLPLHTTLVTTAPAVDGTRGSASATSSDCDSEIRLPSVEIKPKRQGKKGARQKASTKPAKPDRREWIAVLDADGQDVIERLMRNDCNGVLHPMLFRYDGIYELAETLDNVERVQASFHGARFGALARNTAVHAIIGKLCGWATFAEMDEQGVRTWDYFDEAIQSEVQIAMEEARYAA